MESSIFSDRTGRADSRRRIETKTQMLVVESIMFYYNSIHLAIVSQVIKSNKVTTKITMDQHVSDLEQVGDDLKPVHEF